MRGIASEKWADYLANLRVEFNLSNRMLAMLPVKDWASKVDQCDIRKPNNSLSEA